MREVVVSLIIFTCIVGGAVLGILLRALLPERHLSEESRNMVTLGMGIVATMGAIAVGLLIQGAQENFRDQRGDLIDMSAKVVLLDKLLSDYGPEAQAARDTLRNSVRLTIKQLWPRDVPDNVTLDILSGQDTVYSNILSLTPHTGRESSLRNEALSLTYDLAQARYSLVMWQVRSVPGAFIIVLGVIVFWFVAIFFSFGLYAPTNATVVSTLIISALSVSLALFIIMELNRPFDGMLRMPSGPLVEALNSIDK